MIKFGQCMKGIIGNVEKYFQHDILTQFFLKIKTSAGEPEWCSQLHIGLWDQVMLSPLVSGSPA